MSSIDDQFKKYSSWYTSLSPRNLYKVGLNYLEQIIYPNNKRSDPMIALPKTFQNFFYKSSQKKVRCTITGNGVVHVKASDIFKTEQAKEDLAAIQRLRIGSDKTFPPKF